MFMLDCLVGVRKYIGSSVSRKSLPAKADKRGNDLPEVVD